MYNPHPLIAKCQSVEKVKHVKRILCFVLANSALMLMVCFQDYCEVSSVPISSGVPQCTVLGRLLISLHKRKTQQVLSPK